MAKSKEAIAMSALRRKRLKAGLCQRCGRPLEKDDDRLNCAKCREYLKSYNTENYPPKALSSYDWSFIHFRRIAKETTPETSFGRGLRQLMLDQIVSPVYLAEYMGVSTRTIGRWINEGAIAEKRRWGTLMTLFDCQLDDLGLEYSDDRERVH